MGEDLYTNSPAARSVLDSADTAFGGPLTRYCFEGPENALRPTHVQQPAIVAVSVAAFAAFREALGLPGVALAAPSDMGAVAAVAGHSVGLCSALVAAGAMQLAEAIPLVRDRGEFLAAAASRRPGTMAAVLGLDPEVVDALVTRIRTAAPGSYLSVANINSPKQVVVAGDLTSVQALIETASSAGARRAIPLPVSGAFHTIAMLPAQAAMRERLLAVGLREPVVPVVSNVDASLLTTPAQLRAELADHIPAPVRWLDSVRRLGELRVTHVIEFGPGDVLSGLVRRTLDHVAVMNVDTVEAAVTAVKSLRNG